MHKDQKRVVYLDGFRGLAAIGVVLTHLLIVGGGRDHTHVAFFGDRYHWLWPARFGWVGVELFFLISGYVILLTLERCSGFTDFILRRWLRLFPAMLLATIATFAFSRTIQPLDGMKDAPVVDVLPGLTFVHPSIYHAATHVDVDSLDHSYWTIYTEVAFYVIFATLYLCVGWRLAVVGLVGLNVAALVAGPLLSMSPTLRPAARIAEPMDWLGFQYFAWFAAGVLFAKARESDRSRLFAVACALCVVAVFWTKPSPAPTAWSDRAAMFVVAAIFAVAQRWALLQRALEWRPLVFLGFVSYPLYLLHQNVGLGLIEITRRSAPGLPIDLLTLPAIAIVLLLAWLIARYLEPPIRNALLRLLCRTSLVRQVRTA